MLAKIEYNIYVNIYTVKIIKAIDKVYENSLGL